MAKSPRWAKLIILVLFLSLCAPFASANGLPSQPEIFTTWTADESGENTNSYRIKFADDKSYQAEIEVSHLRAGQNLEPSILQLWDLVEGHRIIDIELNTTLAWGDEILISVSITNYDGQELIQPVVATRGIEIGTWNQPMDNHEIMLETTWRLDQSYFNEDGEQGFYLDFLGQGWQQRIDNTVSSWELGEGNITILESNDNGSTNLSLVLNSIWKNETIQSGVLTTQIFEATGSGQLLVLSQEEDLNTTILVDVKNGELNRSLIDGVISEKLRIEATGVLNISSDEDQESSTNIDGEIGVFYLETWDENGVRKFYDQRFEAIAQMVVIDDGTRLDIDINSLVSGETWADGNRTYQIEELIGSGIFGFAESDNESSIIVNGTIYDFHTLVEQGITLTDDLHVDGDITGDVQGTFGIVRGIEETHPSYPNATGVEFPVNIIHQESWFNLTGINGGNFFDGAGVGATHNQTWDYQVIYSDWENRTIKLVWEETGADASSGEEYPERSPIERQPEPPEVDESLGNLTIGRETGLMPIPMVKGDILTLDGQEGLELTVTARDVGNDPRDGHNFHVVTWTGVYGDGELGFANGSIVDQGPLKGLISSVNRTIIFPFGEDENNANLSESQVLTRVISPSVVTAEENSPPIISEISLFEGLVVSEGGSVATLIAEVSDVDWNLQHVFVDLTPIGGQVIEMNDRGLDGDAVIGDDRYTTRIVVPGLQVGLVALNVTAIDSFDVEVFASSNIEIINQAPRITSVEILPDQGPRGTNMVVNLAAYDGHGVSEISIDLRDYGGELMPLTKNGEIWTLMMVVPSGMSPGEQTLEIVLTDSLGKVGISSVWLTGKASQDHPYGPHYIPDDEKIPIVITVENSPPEIVVPINLKYTRGESSSTQIFEIEISDPDGISNARANLGVFAPLGVQNEWVLMNDNGINGDRVSNDGIFTVELSIRSSTPLGTHEIFVQAIDEFDVATSIVPVSITVEEQTNLLTNVDTDTISSTLLIVVLIGFALVAATAVFVLVRKGRDGDGLSDRFGFE